MKVYGPYRNNCGRLFVIISSENRKRTQSYPRYLMEQYLGRPLADDEDVHHKDHNLDNNSLDNLELVQHRTHCRAHALERSRYFEDIEKVCPICGKHFIWTAQQQKYRYGQGAKSDYIFCSKSCAGKYGAQVSYSKNRIIK